MDFILNLFSSIFLPNIAYAETLDEFLGKVNEHIINPIIVLLFALALVIFLFGMAEFIMNADNDEKRSDGKRHMLWGIVGIAIMFSVWAILGIILSTLGIKDIDPKKGKVELNDYNPQFPPGSSLSDDSGLTSGEPE